MALAALRRWVRAREVGVRNTASGVSGPNRFLTPALCGVCIFRIIEELHMDLLMILGTIAFFVVAIVYTIACDKLK
ncbi:MAG: hypothetical protein LAP21_07655 [Acidobacteriia bacterium]|nr:hypothetical protein [Terriglobia bacterium]